MTLNERHSRQKTITFNFEVLPFTRTANGKIVQRLRDQSIRFKRAWLDGDVDLQNTVSRRAWETMHDLLMVIRKAQDNGVTAKGYSLVDTGWLAEALTQVEQQSMMAGKKIDRRHQNARKCSLRECVNKLAHLENSTFRVNGRGSHYVVLTGQNQSKTKLWVCEFNINTFATHCAKVIAQFR